MHGMFSFRVLLTWLLAFALPLQGYAVLAASRCDAPMDMPAQMAIDGDMAQLEQMAPMSMSADGEVSSGQAAASHRGNAFNVGCCHAIAIPPASIVAIASHAAQALADAPAASFESCISALPDKPPRV